LTASFALAEAFLDTSHAVGELALCHVRLQDDARYPWVVLIPRAPAAREIEDLHPLNRARLVDEVVLAGDAVRAIGKALGLAVDKLNVGALGNVTPQLHVHVVGRRQGDAAWPGPVWGQGAAVPLTADHLAAATAGAKLALHL
jgi:diadenosine tetraphosphate (Ap4A) HIT family hydrolase